MLDVLRNHPFALVKKNGNWEVIQSFQQRKTMEALHESEQMQKAILDNIPDRAWLKDKNGRFLPSMERGADSLAWMPRASWKNGIRDPPSGTGRRVREQDRSIEQSRQPLQYEKLLADKDGRKVWFETIKSPLLNDHGNVVEQLVLPATSPC